MVRWILLLLPIACSRPPVAAPVEIPLELIHMDASMMGDEPRWVLSEKGELSSWTFRGGEEREEAVRLPGVRAVTIVRTHSVAQARGVLVGAIDDDGLWSMYWVGDGDGDRLLDVHSARRLFDSFRDLVVTDLLEKDGLWALLDRRRQEVYRARDLDGDGLPDGCDF